MKIFNCKSIPEYNIYRHTENGFCLKHGAGKKASRIKMLPNLNVIVACFTKVI